jgi:hypothetical protein
MRFRTGNAAPARSGLSAVCGGKRYQGVSMATNRERQMGFKERMARDGYAQVALFVPASAKADFQLAAELCRENPALTVGQMKNLDTGRFQSLRKKRA